MHSASLVVALGALLVAVTTTPLGCESTVEKVDGSGSTSGSGSSGASTSDMCSGAASIEGDGNGCPCGVDTCGFCQACEPCTTSADCKSTTGIAKCIHPDDQCGKGMGGECHEIPPGDCNPLDARVCLCDGGVTSKYCATAFGFDVSSDLAPCVGGTFACGDQICDDFVEYCVEVTGESSSHQCVPTPPACSSGIADCSCIDEPGGKCSIEMNDQILVLYFAP